MINRLVAFDIRCRGEANERIFKGDVIIILSVWYLNRNSVKQLNPLYLS